MIYVDTSALIKRYLVEPFSKEFEALFLRGGIAISRLSQVEFRCLLARRQRNKEIDAQFVSRADAEFSFDIQTRALDVVSVNDAEFTSAYFLIQRFANFSLRTLDALHLAIAQAQSIPAFATADKTQAAAAEALGMSVHGFY